MHCFAERGVERGILASSAEFAPALGPHRDIEIAVIVRGRRRELPGERGIRAGWRSRERRRDARARQNRRGPRPEEHRRRSGPRARLNGWRFADGRRRTSADGRGFGSPSPMAMFRRRIPRLAAAGGGCPVAEDIAELLNPALEAVHVELDGTDGSRHLWPFTSICGRGRLFQTVNN
jgi:hypothetical protein